MAETVHINMNDVVEVTLTAKGLTVFRAHERFQDSCIPARLAIASKHLPDDVWSGSLWEAFQIFGAHIGMGRPVPFDKNELRVPCGRGEVVTDEIKVAKDDEKAAQKWLEKYQRENPWTDKAAPFPLPTDGYVAGCASMRAEVDRLRATIKKMQARERRKTMRGRRP